jgi:hypothetical protein
MEKKVFLGGTCNESKWREKLIPMLEMDYFTPVVDDWTEEDYKNELKEREKDDFLLYVITPKMTGVYSIAEAVQDSNKNPDKTIFCFLKEDEGKKFDKDQEKSLDKVGEMVKKNGAKYFDTLEKVSFYLNFKNKEINK